MEAAFWDRVVADGHKLPTDLPLADLTAELTTMLGSADPYQRDAIAFPTLATWVSGGVYDDLLEGLGDGMTAGLAVGIGEDGTDTVFRRSFSALVLAVVLERATTLATTIGTACPTTRCCAGATGSRAGWCASGTSAGSSSARGGRTPWRTAPTRSAPSPRHR